MNRMKLGLAALLIIAIVGGGLGLMALIGNEYKKAETEKAANDKLQAERHDELKTIALNTAKTVEERETKRDAAHKKAVEDTTTELLALRDAMEASKDENARLLAQLQEAHGKHLAEQQAADAQKDKRVAALEKMLREIHFPPLQEGEEPVLEWMVESIGHLSKTDHLATFIHWREKKPAPDAKLLKELRELHTVCGTTLGDVIMLQALKDEAPRQHVQEEDLKKGDKYLSWYPCWRYTKAKDKAHVPVAFLCIQFYQDRARVYWYKDRYPKLTDEQRVAFRLQLLVVARQIGLPAGSRSEWVTGEGHTDLIFKSP